MSQDNGSNDAYKRAVAKTDYFRMPADERNINDLWRRYVAERQAGKEVPTTTRSKIYQWAKEDSWNYELAKQEETAREAEAAVVLQDRQRAAQKMHAIFDVALEQWLELIQNSDEDAVKARLILGLADRLGWVPATRSMAATRAMAEANDESNPREDAPTRPEEGANDVAWSEYMSAQSRHEGN